MSEEIKNTEESVEETGSSTNGPEEVKTDGQPLENGSEETVSKKEYEDAQSEIGRLGKEVGDYSQFFESISPLLDKLDSNPALVQAIVEGKIDDNLAKGVMEGKISLDDAKEVEKAHTEVKKDLGKKYEKTSEEEISKYIEEKLASFKNEFDSKLKETQDYNDYKEEVEAFINKTDDFANYAAEIDAWLDEHPNVKDISIAYYAVKGKLSEKDAQKRSDAAAAEEAKNLAANAGGGSSKSTAIKTDSDLVDQLIGNVSDPNSF